MTDDDPWADVFAAAEGTITSGSPPTETAAFFYGTNTKRPNNVLSHSKKAGASLSPCEEYLKNDRSRVVTKEPHWMSLKDGVSQKNVNCKKFRGSGSASLGQRTCLSCGCSALCHRAEVRGSAKNRQASDHIMFSSAAIFIFLRNLRHGARLCFDQRMTHGVGSWAKQSLDEMESLTSTIPQSFSTLRSKFFDLSSHLRKMHRAEGSTLIQAIILCDECYFQLYYTCIIGQLPDCRDDAQRIMYIPHPTFYFGEAFFGGELDNAQRTTQKLKEDASALSSGPSLVDWHHLDIAAVCEEDALTALHHFRYLETIHFFLISKDALADFNSEQEIFFATLKHQNTAARSAEDAVHETPAPKLLAEWRDSCRDFLTHLYAYATLPDVILDKVVEFCSHDNDRALSVVELGAGTGYIASLLLAKGLTVDAYDIQPPSRTHGQQPTRDIDETNDYHGNTPTFTNVKQGSCDVWSSSHESGRKKHKKKCRKQKAQSAIDCSSNKVLLMCYPPPEPNTMAYDCLRAFSSSDGYFFIHIGEFHGLTGTRAFENYLMQHFQCVGRYSCPSWGTDAAEVTMWKKRSISFASLEEEEPSSKAGNVLIPCARCGTEAARRLRLLRYLNYCSQACFDVQQGSVLRLHAQCAGLHDIEHLSFDRKDHFYTFPQA